MTPDTLSAVQTLYDRYCSDQGVQTETVVGLGMSAPQIAVVVLASGREVQPTGSLGQRLYEMYCLSTLSIPVSTLGPLP